MARERRAQKDGMGDNPIQLCDCYVRRESLRGHGGRWNRFGRGDKIMASCAPLSLSQKCDETMPKLRK